MEVKVVLFDLGNVLVDYDNWPICEALARQAGKEAFRDPLRVRSFIFDRASGIENAFDRGEISSEDFFSVLKREIGLDLAFDDFLKIWNHIFSARPWAESLIGFLKGKVGLALLSNTNPLHFQHVMGMCPWLGMMDHLFVSYELGSRKPEAAIYRKAMEVLGIDPEGVLFLDDLEENLLPAREMGMRAFRVTKEKEAPQLLMNHLSHLPWHTWELSAR